jgi:hypothetical protein
MSGVTGIGTHLKIMTETMDKPKKPIANLKPHLTIFKRNTTILTAKVFVNLYD